MNNIDMLLDQLITKEQPSVVQISTDKLHPFPAHPFKVQDDEDMEQLTQSIQSQGVLTPLVILQLENGEYEVISGHRRLHACRKAGIQTVPALVYAIDRDTAAIALVDSNLHRERILPSEKALAYKLKMDALSKQGKRTDLTSDQVGPKLTAATLSSEDSASQVKRYIRLTMLIPKLLAMVDDNKISFSVGVELSYLTKTEQTDLFEFIEAELCTPSLSQAQKLKKLSQEGTLNTEEISSIMKQPKANQVVTVKIPDDKISKYLKPTATVKEKEDFLARAVEYYGKHLMKQKDRGAR